MTKETNDFVFVDTETTDLLQPMGNTLDFQPWVFEVFIYRTDSKLNYLDKFESLINIPVQIPLFISKMTGIYDADLIGKPTFNKLTKPINKILKGSKLFIAHNATFDWHMIDNSFQRCNEKHNLPTNLLCMVEQSYHLRGYRLTQGELYEILTGKKYQTEKQHRAKKDVQKMVENYKILSKDFPKCF